MALHWCHENANNKLALVSQSITVLGAGSVGVGTAIHLQQRGWQVTLVDRSKPASQTSFGNAGVINASSFIPLNNHGLWASLPRLLKNNQAQLRYRWSHLLRDFPWLVQFLKHANKRDTEASSLALNKLCALALDEHRALMQRAGNMHRLSQRGWLKLFRTGPGFNPNNLDGAFYEQFGIGVDVLTADEVYDLEPSLNRIFKSGFLLRDSAQVNSPGDLIKEYVQQFVADGGRVIETNVHALAYEKDEFVLHATEPLRTKHLVVAAGPWSADVLKPLGYRVLLGVERGYHQHFHAQEGASLSRTIHDIDAGYIVAPMQNGLRLTTGVELAMRDAPDNLAQLQQVIPRAREAFPLAEPTEDPIWRGSRPTLPDSRPIIGQAPKHKNLWLAFGHQHIGLMSGPISGKLLAQQISGEQPDIDITPFRASRWVKHR